MHIEQKNITGRIHLLIFDTQRDVASTFLRFQEFYESPMFSGKIFTLKEFREWYSSVRGSFTYYTDWNGFNIPSYILKPFYAGKFDPLSEKERRFLKRFKDKQEPFYVIGVYKATKNPSVYLKHEVAHGLFYIDKDYRCEVLKLLSEFDVEAIKEKLRSKEGYHEQVLDDEVNAYGIDTGKKLRTLIPTQLVKKLRRLYKKYLKINNVRFPTSI